MFQSQKIMCKKYKKTIISCEMCGLDTQYAIPTNSLLLLLLLLLLFLHFLIFLWLALLTFLFYQPVVPKINVNISLVARSNRNLQFVSRYIACVCVCLCLWITQTIKKQTNIHCCWPWIVNNLGILFWLVELHFK